MMNVMTASEAKQETIHVVNELNKLNSEERLFDIVSDLTSNEDASMFIFNVYEKIKERISDGCYEVSVRLPDRIRNRRDICSKIVEFFNCKGYSTYSTISNGQIEQELVVSWILPKYQKYYYHGGLL